MIQQLRRLLIRVSVLIATRRIKKLATIGTNVLLSHHFVFKCETAGSLYVGNNVSLNGLWVTQGGGSIKIGNYCSFRTGTYVGSSNFIIIGDHVYGAENVFIIDNNNHPISPKERKEMTMTQPNSPSWKWNERVISSPIIIEDNVWLGRNCMILKGVRIGEGSIVAAGAVVTKEVPPFSIVAGNPARVVRKIEKDY
ncbi:MAG: acyltransferase [Cyclobacteriaceae bacterium]